MTRPSPPPLLEVFDDGLTAAERRRVIFGFGLEQIAHDGRVEPLLQETRLAFRAYLDTPDTDENAPAIDEMETRLGRLIFRDAIRVAIFGTDARLVSMPPDPARCA